MKVNNIPFLSEIDQESPLKSSFVLIILAYHKEQNIIEIPQETMKGSLTVVIIQYEVLVSTTVGASFCFSNYVFLWYFVGSSNLIDALVSRALKTYEDTKELQVPL